MTTNRAPDTEIRGRRDARGSRGGLTHSPEGLTPSPSGLRRNAARRFRGHGHVVRGRFVRGRFVQDRSVRGRDRDRGQTAIEFLGMTPFIILIMLVLWECALIGYTWSLAGNAADVGARKGSGAEYAQSRACKKGAKAHLPDAWKDNVKITCRSGRELYKADVKLKVPVLVPGLFDLDVKITGHAGSPLEG
ncbi:TadE family protein [Streptomyces sp. NPDC079020]|uniref:TadE family protein n=1 Tax=Streptomyces sp. NPDC079020 TaxID=3365722 RepID=UPI0037D4CE9B